MLRKPNEAAKDGLAGRQSRLPPGRACDEFVRGLNDLPIGADEIPDFPRRGHRRVGDGSRLRARRQFAESAAFRSALPTAPLPAPKPVP
jgi:hypothetical protein